MAPLEESARSFRARIAMTPAATNPIAARVRISVSLIPSISARDAAAP
jgi:hypothetical protein